MPARGRSACEQSAGLFGRGAYELSRRGMRWPALDEDVSVAGGPQPVLLCGGVLIGSRDAGAAEDIASSFEG